MLRLLSPLSSKLLVRLLHSRHLHSTPSLSTMDLKTIINKLEEIAPSKFAENWDNVGLLVEPKQMDLISRVLLTNDLTEQVMEDAVSLPGDKIGLIISYHPPIFRPMKRLIQNSAKERIILRAIEAGMAVYSPHTALDPMINDWLLSGLGEGKVSSLGVGKSLTKLSNLIQLSGASMESVKGICDSMNLRQNVSFDDDGKSGISLLCGDSTLAELLPTLKEQFPTSEISIKANQQYDHIYQRGGKKLSFSSPLTLSQLVTKVKQHLHLSHVRLATPPCPSNQKRKDPIIKTISVCAGSGGSVLSGVASDVYLTGEMGHHDVLEAVSRGVAVILCEHSNTERGFLQQVYKKQIETVLGGKVEVVIAENDRDPLQIV